MDSCNSVSYSIDERCRAISTATPASSLLGLRLTELLPTTHGPRAAAARTRASSACSIESGTFRGGGAYWIATRLSSAHIVAPCGA